MKHEEIVRVYGFMMAHYPAQLYMLSVNTTKPDGGIADATITGEWQGLSAESVLTETWTSSWSCLKKRRSW